MQSIVKAKVIKALKTDKENDHPNLLPLSIDHGPTMDLLNHSRRIYTTLFTRAP